MPPREFTVRQGSDEIDESVTRYVRSFTATVKNEEGDHIEARISVPFVIFASDQSQAFNPGLITFDEDDCDIDHPTKMHIVQKIIDTMLANGFDRNVHLVR